MSTATLEAAEVEIVQDSVLEFRRDGFLALGFTVFQAEALADAVDEIGFPIYRGDVEKLLARVAGDHAIAFDLLT